MKKLLAIVMTLSVAVILGMGAVGCSKTNEAKKVETNSVTKPGVDKMEVKKTETVTTPKQP